MKLFISKFVDFNQNDLNQAELSQPEIYQIADRFSGYGIYFAEKSVIVWDRKRVWVLSRTGWEKWFQRPTVCGSMYQRLGFVDCGKIKFNYNQMWNLIIPPKTSDISRRMWVA
jgi:hypothetical protein